MADKEVSKPRADLHAAGTERARRLYAQKLWEAANEAYPDGMLRKACEAEGGEPLVRIYTRVKEVVDTGRTTHAIKAMRQLMRLGKLKGDGRLAALLETIAISGGVPGPDFASLSEPWSKELAPFLEMTDSDSGRAEYVGPIIIVRDFTVAGAKDNARFGLPAHKVKLSAGPALRLDARIPLTPEVRPGGADKTKYVLANIDVPNTRDAKDIARFDSLTLTVASTNHHTVFRSDPFFHRENRRAWLHEKLPKAIKSLRPTQLQANRVALGRLDPAANRIPYQLTLFYTIVLRDDHVLLMRRHNSAVGYYPNTVEPSGGEQLDATDFKLSPSERFNEFEQWTRRAVVEEYFPTEGLDKSLLKEPAERVFDGKSNIYFQAIGYNVLDGSFPLFALVQLDIDLEEYLAICEELTLKHHLRPRFENEGRRGWSNPTEIAEGFEDGKICMTKMNGIGAPRRKDSFNLTRADLHPMTLARFQLLWKGYPGWWR